MLKPLWRDTKANLVIQHFGVADLFLALGVSDPPLLHRFNLIVLLETPPHRCPSLFALQGIDCR